MASTATTADADPRAAALSARASSRAFAAAPTSVRVAALENLAAGLLSRSDEILKANAEDVAAAKSAGSDVEPALLQRLALTEPKLQTLASGIRAIAAAREPLGAVSSRTEVAEGGLVLEKTACPIGVLLVIFESRPDALPQIAALALRSGNGLLLKGGKEASRSNAILHDIVVDSVARATMVAGVDASGLVALVTSRAGVADLLRLDDVIDLVIPRGGNALVTHVQRNTRIPVLGHADGVCHVYVDGSYDVERALPILLDSKLDYPAACNAVETVLVHSSWAASPPKRLEELVRALQAGGVTVRAWRDEESKTVGGVAVEENAEAFDLLSKLPVAPARRHEYGSPDLTLEVVSGVTDAVRHIHAHGSGHTDAILSDDASSIKTFVDSVDSACVFTNASTRFADGFRFGLGAEVGISTSRIHARGPVGVEGLLTTKWKLVGEGHVVAKDKGVKYTHKELPL